MVKSPAAERSLKGPRRSVVPGHPLFSGTNKYSIHLALSRPEVRRVPNPAAAVCRRFAQTTLLTLQYNVSTLFLTFSLKMSSKSRQKGKLGVITGKSPYFVRYICFPTVKAKNCKNNISKLKCTKSDRLLRYLYDKSNFFRKKLKRNSSDTSFYTSVMPPCIFSKHVLTKITQWTLL